MQSNTPRSAQSLFSRKGRGKMSHPQSILVIDDDPVIGQFFSQLCLGMDLRCEATTRGERFLEVLRPENSLIVLDLLLPDMDGIELLRILGERRCKTPILLMSGVDRRILDTAERLAKALNLQVAGTLRKPFRMAQVEAILQQWRRPGEAISPSYAADFTIPDAAITRAVENDEFVLHYQPQIDLLSEEVTGMEALIRWQRTPQTLIFPDAFLPRMTAMGLMDRLNLLAHRRGLSEFPQFKHPGTAQPSLSLNVSATSLLDLKLPDTLAALAVQYGIDSERIIVEVTEGEIFKDLTKILDVLARLRLKGFQISIDDFGTGYAMMQQLRHIPATEIKIDQSFIRNMQGSSSDRVVVEKTVEIGHELGMRVVGEGVETAEQLRFLREIRCDVVQGYYFSKPLGAKEFQIWLSKYGESAAGRGGSWGAESGNLELAEPRLGYAAHALA